MEEIPSKRSTLGGKNLKHDFSFAKGKYQVLDFEHQTIWDKIVGNSKKSYFFMKKHNFSWFLKAILGVGSKNPYLSRTRPY